MKTTNLTLSLCIVTAMASPGKPLTAMTWECGERSNLPQEGKNYCAAGDFRQSEINLQKVLETLQAKHNSAYGESSALSSAQAAFEDYRNNQCIAENKRISDEPYHPMLVAQCKTRLTNLRIDELNKMLKKAIQ